jgi:hypothetical protein
VGAVSLVPHPPQRSVSDGVVAVPLAAVVLNTSSLTGAPDPHRLLLLGRLRLCLARPVQRDRCTPTFLLLSIGQERRVGTLAVPPKPVDRIDRVYRCVGTMKEHKQSSKLDRVSARMLGRCGHRRSVVVTGTPPLERVPRSAQGRESA